MGSNEIIVTGHSGFVGASLTPQLDKSGRRWVGLSRSTGHDLSLAMPPANVPDANLVIHLAGVAGVLNSWRDPALFHRMNVGATLTALEIARERRASFVFVSSYMYGVPKRLPVDETHPLAWNNPYAASKRVAEMLCQTYADNFGMPVVIIRPFNLFGPCQSTEFLIPHVVHQALTGDIIEVDDITPRRDYLWVEDLATALIAVLDAPNRASGTFNVGRGKSHSVAEVTEAVQACLGPRRLRCRDEVRRNEIPDCICDFSRFNATYGWQPQVSLEEGIRRMVEPGMRPIPIQ